MQQYQNWYSLLRLRRKKINDYLSIFILRLGRYKSVWDKVNIFDIHHIYKDIHIYNELLCGYLHLSSTYLKSKFSIDEVDYVDIKYCKDFYFENNSTFTFNDDMIYHHAIKYDYIN